MTFNTIFKKKIYKMYLHYKEREHRAQNPNLGIE